MKMTDEEILKAFGLTKESPISEQIVQTTHHLLFACDKISELEEQNGKLETRCAELFLQNNEFAERFEKSIEIIKGLLPCCRNYPQENAKKVEQAKQFLKEIKKKMNLALELSEIEKQVSVLISENIEYKKQLIKAKELLNGCIFKARGNVNPSWSELINDIGQFLRETDIENAIQQANEGLDLDEGCPNILCEDCTREECTVRKLGLVPTKEIEK